VRPVEPSHHATDDSVDVAIEWTHHRQSPGKHRFSSAAALVIVLVLLGGGALFFYAESRRRRV
jgi:hypothetical protein